MKEKIPTGILFDFHQLGPKCLIEKTQTADNKNHEHYAKLSFNHQKIITRLYHTRLVSIMENLTNYCIQLEGTDSLLLSMDEQHYFKDISAVSGFNRQFTIHIFDRTGQRLFGTTYVYPVKIDDQDTIINQIDNDLDADKSLILEHIQNRYMNMPYLKLAEQLYRDVQTKQLPGSLKSIVVCHAEKRIGLLNRQLSDLPQYP